MEIQNVKWDKVNSLFFIFDPASTVLIDFTIFFDIYPTNHCSMSSWLLDWLKSDLARVSLVLSLVIKSFLKIRILLMAGSPPSPISRPDPNWALKAKLQEIKELRSKGYYYKAKFLAKKYRVLEYFHWPR